uniref:MADF domain-containing protein n=1 Tax=Vespula pensylvanica TaxID=30213 RepID=A0A834K0B2_VESPE|nr:hypothetical protein H0235_016373 [Vespula pensylvanica]
MFDTERFIEEIEKRPAIYDVNRSEYNDRNAKMSAWEEVCQVMVPNWTRLSDEERNMEGIYAKELAREVEKYTRLFHERVQTAATEVPETGFGTPEAEKRDEDSSRSRITNTAGNQCKSEESEGEGDNPVIEESDVPLAHAVPSLTTGREYVQTGASFKMCPRYPKQLCETSLTSFDNEIHDILSSHSGQRVAIDEEDYDKMFLLSLLPTIRQIPEEKKLDVRIQMQQGKAKRKKGSFLGDCVGLLPRIGGRCPLLPDVGAGCSHGQDAESAAILESKMFTAVKKFLTTSPLVNKVKFLMTRQNSGVVGKTGGEEKTSECPSRMSVRTTTIVSTTQTTMTTATRTPAITSPPLSVLSKESDAIVPSIGSTESQVQVQSQVQDIKGESSGGSDTAFPSSSSSSSTVVPMTDSTKLSSNALMSFPASPQKLAAQPRKITAITKSQMRGELPLDRKDPSLLTFLILMSDDNLTTLGITNTINETKIS